MSAPCPRLGFTVPFPADAAARAALDAALDRLGLEATGERPRLVVTRVGSQTTEADRDAVIAWAADRAGRGDGEIGPLVDLRG